MQQQGFSEITSEDLRRKREQQVEGDYALVDVRQPEEYKAGHIPGATLLPLGEVENSLDKLPPDKDVVFYCAAGKRSAMAARLAVESGRFQSRLLSLQGGFGAWDGLSLPDFPKVELFAADDSLHEMLLRAMEQEKGAMRLYTSVGEAAAGPRGSKPICSLMQELAGFEEAHAKAVYDHLQKHWQDAREIPPFQELFDSMAGTILEGGRDVSELDSWIRDARQGGCMELAELALELEMSALDLYNALADRMKESAIEAEDVFRSLAQQEKSHARLIMKHLDEFVHPLQGREDS